jgi:hypothetical protein
MKINKAAAYLGAIAGLMFLAAGLRDIFAPGFFSISPTPPDPTSIALTLFVGVVFLGFAAAQAVIVKRGDGAR